MIIISHNRLLTQEHDTLIIVIILSTNKRLLYILKVIHYKDIIYE